MQIVHYIIIIIIIIRRVNVYFAIFAPLIIQNI